MTDDEIATGLVANLPRIRARNMLDMVAAIGVVFSESGDVLVRDLMRAAGLSDKEAGEGEVQAWLAAGKTRAKGKVERWR